MEADSRRPDAAEQDRRYWRLAAVLFFGGGMGAIPSDALHRPTHPPEIYLLPLLALVSGVVCLFCATRVSGRWLQVVTVVATLEIALTVAFADSVFAIYYTFVAIYAAYVFSERRTIGFLVGFASLAALAPIAYDPDSARETLMQGFALIPTLVLSAGTVTFLRERFEASEQRYRELAERDALTGVGNYRMLTNRLRQELERHRRYEHSLAVILVDLDDFKQVNDRHGHQRGDDVLVEVGRVLRESVRVHDVVVRQGGDEFCVVAPETDRERAEDLATRIREALCEIVIEGERLCSCTGVAVYPDDAGSLEALMASSDTDLRVAKGRKQWRARSEEAAAELRGSIQQL